MLILDHHQPGDKQRRSQTTEEALSKANWIVSQTIIELWSIITKIKTIFNLWASLRAGVLSHNVIPSFAGITELYDTAKGL